MRQIYANAQSVVVWLDVDSWNRLKVDRLEIAFQIVTHVASGLSSRGFPALESDIQMAQNSYSAALENIKLILNLKWWDRVWIIQEIASNRNVIVQCRSHTINWDEMCRFIEREASYRDFDADEGRVAFVRRVQSLRSDDVEDPPYGLVSLTHDFRYSLATNDRDKLYALRGLVRSEEHTPQFAVDYSLSEKDVWSQFAKECLTKYRSLNVFALIDSIDHGHVGSWDAKHVDWIPERLGGFSLSSERQKPENLRQPLWTGSGVTPDEQYSASGVAKARCRTELADPQVIGVQGYIVDVIEECSDAYNQLAVSDKRREVLKKWKAFIDASGCQSPAKMLQAMRWYPDHNSISNAFLNSSMLHLRRIVRTRGQTIGLVHSDAQPGDLICVLLGSDVPYVLRR